MRLISLAVESCPARLAPRNQRRSPYKPYQQCGCLYLISRRSLRGCPHWCPLLASRCQYQTWDSMLRANACRDTSAVLMGEYGATRIHAHLPEVLQASAQLHTHVHKCTLTESDRERPAGRQNDTNRDTLTRNKEIDKRTGNPRERERDTETESGRLRQRQRQRL
eukprot:2542395-Rhodomonas_salina.4